MPNYQYTVRDATGAMRTGTTQVDSVEILSYLLQQQGFELVQANPLPEVRERSSRVRVSRTEVLVFWIQFSIMIDKEVSPVRALDIAAERAESLRFATVLKDVALQVCGGVPFHKALAQYPNVFDTATVGIIHAGETANAMSDATHRLIQFMERDRAAERGRKRS